MSKTKGKRPPKGVRPKHLIGKGFDSHPENINRKGRPAYIDILRKAAQEVANDVIKLTPKEMKKLRVNTASLSRLKRILFDLAISGNHAKQKLFIEAAFGKIPIAIDLTSGGETIKGYAVFDPSQWPGKEQDSEETE